MLHRLVSFAAVGLARFGVCWISSRAATVPNTIIQQSRRHRPGARARRSLWRVVRLSSRQLPLLLGMRRRLVCGKRRSTLFPVTVPTESLAFRPWKFSSNFFTFPQ